MRFTARFTAAMAAAALLGATLLETGARAAEPPCVTPRELQTMVGFALPLAIEGVAKRCAANLGPGAFLSREGASLARRYRAEAPTDWSQARPIFERLAHADLPPPDPLNQSFERQIAEHAVADRIASAVHPHDCEKVDMAIELMAPLHADDVALVTGLLARAVAKSDRPVGHGLPLALCPRSAER